MTAPSRPASGMFWGAILLGIGTAFWLHRKLAALESDGLNSRFFRFVASGYFIDEAGAKVVVGLDRVGGWLRDYVDGRLWNRWIPELLGNTLQRAGTWASVADEWIARSSRDAVVRITDAPTRLLQVIQNGNVQWYLIFALGSGFAILVHFLRT